MNTTDNNLYSKQLKDAVELIRNSKHTTVFSGAGISVESGILPFRGEGGLWEKINPLYFEIEYFKNNPEESWKIIKEIFYTQFKTIKPNLAHIAIAKLEKKGYVKTVITQNIDNLHVIAGSKKVIEFHGTARTVSCQQCSFSQSTNQLSLEDLPPLCPECSTPLKPDFIFFGESLPRNAYRDAQKEANTADVFIVIGTTGEVVPACQIPYEAKKNQAKIIEINLHESTFTHSITDIFLKGPATRIMSDLYERII